MQLCRINILPMKNLFISLCIIGSFCLLSCEKQKMKKEEKERQQKSAEQQQQQTDSLRKEVEKAQ